MNKHGIDPRASYARFRDPRVGAYLDGREVLVCLQKDIDFDHPDFDQRVDALDDKL